MKKICFISNLFPSKKDPSFGSFVGLNFQQLKGMGYELGRPIVIDARVKALPKLLAYLRFVLSGVKAVLNSKSYDFFYIHYLTYSTLCLIPVLPFKKVKYLVNIHGDDLVGNRLIHKIMGIPSGYILKHATAIVVPTQYFKRQLLLLYPFVALNKVIISESGGFREDIFYPKNKKSLDESAPLHFGYISRIDEGKGWELMLEAFALLKEHQPEKYSRTILSVYGAGAQTNEFLAMVQKLKLEDVVSYYGPLEQTKLGDKYRSFDYFLFPTRRESFGLVAIESLACGTPIICSEIEPLIDLVTHADNGYLFEDGCIIALYENILNCYSLNDESYASLSKSAISSVEKYKSVQVANRLHKEIDRAF